MHSQIEYRPQSTSLWGATSASVPAPSAAHVRSTHHDHNHNHHSSVQGATATHSNYNQFTQHQQPQNIIIHDDVFNQEFQALLSSLSQPPVTQVLSRVNFAAAHVGQTTPDNPSIELPGIDQGQGPMLSGNRHELDVQGNGWGAQLNHGLHHHHHHQGQGQQQGKQQQLLGSGLSILDPDGGVIPTDPSILISPSHQRHIDLLADSQT